MLVAFPSHKGDIALLLRLLRWIRALDGTLRNHDALLALDAGTPFDLAMEAERMAEEIFREVRVFSTDKHYSGWPVACNQMWWAISKYVQEHWPQPWLLVEPDAVPLCLQWLGGIALEYSLCRQPFMGAIEDCQMPMMPSKVMSGVAVYPADCYKRIPPMPGSVRPWNTDASSITVPNGAHTALIKDFFGQQNRPPLFVESKTPTSPSHHFTLDWLPKEAVLFHRDKTHSLIPLLAKKLDIEWTDEVPTVAKPRLAVVFPVHPGDIQLALAHALWLRKLNTRWNHSAVIAFDPTLPNGFVNQFKMHLDQCFASVEVHQYTSPPIPVYPQAANWAWQSCAHHMSNQSSPWLWMEADAVVLKANWLDVLQAEYDRAGKTWMGPLVHQLGHIQGTAVYPASAVHLMPRAMACGNGEAFDMVAKGDMGEDRHDCGHLFHHVWSILNDAPCPVGGGSLPGPMTLEQARRWFPKEAVVTHRWKTRHLIDLLLTGQYQHT